MSAQHTPGSWMVRSYNASSVGTKDYMTAIIYGENREEETANANLIAAAPELLEALEQALTSMQDSGYSDNHVTVKAARDAIAKSKGETK